MRPQKAKPQEELFPFVEMEKLIPENHMLRLVDRHVDFSFIDELVDHTYSETTGRPATDPELLVRILVIGYLYNLSENRLFEELSMHAAYRWFCNLGFYDKIPHRTTLNHIRNHRWARDGIFEMIMNNIVVQCIEAGLVHGRHVTVDGTKIRANASIKSLEPIELEVGVDEYLKQLHLTKTSASAHAEKKDADTDDFHGEKFSNATHRSRTDPDARLYRKSDGQETALSYIGNTMIDTKSRVILATKVVQPGVASETDAALAMFDSLARSDDMLSLLPIETISADKGYGSTTFIRSLFEKGITPHIPPKFAQDQESQPVYVRTTHDPEKRAKRWENMKDIYARNKARALAQTSLYKLSQRTRKRVEHIFAEAKQWHGLGRARGRRLQSVQQQAYLTACVQNIKRLVAYKEKKTKKGALCTAICNFKRISNMPNDFSVRINLLTCNIVTTFVAFLKNIVQIRKLSFSQGF